MAFYKGKVDNLKRKINQPVEKPKRPNFGEEFCMRQIMIQHLNILRKQQRWSVAYLVVMNDVKGNEENGMDRWQEEGVNEG